VSPPIGAPRHPLAVPPDSRRPVAATLAVLAAAAAPLVVAADGVAAMAAAEERPRRPGLRCIIRGSGKSQCGPAPRVGRCNSAVGNNLARPCTSLHPSMLSSLPRAGTCPCQAIFLSSSTARSCLHNTGRFSTNSGHSSNPPWSLLRRLHRGHRGLDLGISNPLRVTSAP
jgi:hypothetical protein